MKYRCVTSPRDGWLCSLAHGCFTPVLREMGVDGHVHAGIMRGRLYPTSTARLGSLVSYLGPEVSACSYPPSALFRLVMSSLSLSLVLFLWRDQSGVWLYNRHYANASVAGCRGHILIHHLSLFGLHAMFWVCGWLTPSSTLWFTSTRRCCLLGPRGLTSTVSHRLLDQSDEYKRSLPLACARNASGGDLVLPV